MPGRNDPCYCGSGKKYKNCHWKEDQQQAAERARVERARAARLDALGAPSDSELRGLYEEVTGRNAPVGPLAAEAREMLTQTWQQRQLNRQARAALEPEWTQWEQHFAEHEAEFDAIAQELARDPFFDSYVLTDENVGKVRSQLGELPDDEAALSSYATEAVALSLDDEDRANFNEAIVSLLPDLLEAGRTREAYVAAVCADRVLQPDAPISPFLRDVVVRSLSA